VLPTSFDLLANSIGEQLPDRLRSAGRTLQG
jgi:hypothetical protein